MSEKGQPNLSSPLEQPDTKSRFFKPRYVLGAKLDKLAKIVGGAEVHSLEDLPLGEVAQAVDHLYDFTIEQLAKELSVKGLNTKGGHNMTTKRALAVLRDRVYELGRLKVIEGEMDIDSQTGNAVSVWKRTNEGDKILDKIIDEYKK